MVELVLVLVTGGLHLVFENVLHLKGPFIIAAVAFWAGYIAVRRRRDPQVFHEWGFRTDTLKPAAVACGIVFAVGAAGMIAYAALQGRLALPPTFWALLLLYPVWGIVQQFLLNALVARNLARRLPAAAVIPLTAVLFGVAHVPDWALSALTIAAGLAWVPIYLRWPNLLALGVCHGFLGSLVYPLVLGRDVVAEASKFLP